MDWQQIEEIGDAIRQSELKAESERHLSILNTSNKLDEVSDGVHNLKSLYIQDIEDLKIENKKSKHRFIWSIVFSAATLLVAIATLISSCS